MPLISHCNGSPWSEQGSAQIQGQLYDLDFRNDQVVAVGERFDADGGSTQLVLTETARGFSVAPGPVAAPGGLLALTPMSGELLTGGYLVNPDHSLLPFSAITQRRWTLG